MKKNFAPLPLCAFAPLPLCAFAPLPLCAFAPLCLIYALALLCLSSYNFLPEGTKYACSQCDPHHV